MERRIDVCLLPSYKLGALCSAQEILRNSCASPTYSRTLSRAGNETWIQGSSEGLPWENEDSRVDLVYLRNSDKKRVLGVINNRTANFFTMGDKDALDANEKPTVCSYFSTVGEWEALGYHDPNPLSSLNDMVLKIKDVEGESEFIVNFYNPLSAESLPGNPYSGPHVVSSNEDGIIQFANFPALHPATAPFLLVEVTKVGTPFLARLDNTREVKFESKEKIVQSIPTGIPGESQSVAVHPNPFSTEIVVTFNSNIGRNATFKLFDVAGREVYNLYDHAIAVGDNALPIGYLPSGYYTLQIDLLAGQTTFYKLIRQ
jgi:hypothetical protein